MMVIALNLQRQALGLRGPISLPETHWAAGWGGPASWGGTEAGAHGRSDCLSHVAFFLG